jgi:NAD(P)H-hydrate epimerase
VIELEPAFPVLPASAVPAVTAAQMAEVDRLALDEFGIDLPQMVEQAGSHLAELVRIELGCDLRGRRVIIAVGPGNNGAGGLAAARHLSNRGARVRVVLARPVNRLVPAARHQLVALLEMPVDCCVAIYDVSDEDLDAELNSADAVVDAVLGYGMLGSPQDDIGRLVRRIAASPAPIISLDLPSGVDPDTGLVAGPAVTARATLTLGLPKRGLLAEVARRYVGRLHLADLGLPPALYARLGVDAGMPFAVSRIVRLEPTP